MGAAVLIYYAIIGIIYYRQDIKEMLHSKPRFGEKPEKPPPVGEQQIGQPERTNDLTEPQKQHWQNEALFARV